MFQLLVYKQDSDMLYWCQWSCFSTAVFQFEQSDIREAVSVLDMVHHISHIGCYQAACYTTTYWFYHNVDPSKVTIWDVQDIPGQCAVSGIFPVYILLLLLLLLRMLYLLQHQTATGNWSEWSHVAAFTVVYYTLTTTSMRYGYSVLFPVHSVQFGKQP